MERVTQRRPVEGLGRRHGPRTSMSFEERYVAFARGSMRSIAAPGLTTTRSVRLSVRSPRSGPHVLWIESAAGKTYTLRFEPTEDLARSDGTFSVLYPPEDDSSPALEPGTPHRFTLRHMASDEKIGEGSFTTAPLPGSAGARHTTLGVLSCNDPFNDDGTLSADALRALEVAPETYAAHGVDRVILAGDQVYGDLPKSISLFDEDFFHAAGPPHRRSILDCSADEIRMLYQARHRAFWKTERFRELQSRFACHPILDDHEIIDNFGSLPEHGAPAWSAVREGAMAAFHDYQGRRIFGDARPPVFDHGFRHGHVAVYVLDLRSCRRVRDGQIEILGRAQRARLASFLERNGDASCAVLVLSVPILHVPDWIPGLASKLSREGSDADDRWGCPNACDSRDALFALLQHHLDRFPRQRLVFVGGDIHIGTAMSFEFEGASRPCVQLVSSPIANVENAMARVLAERLPSLRSLKGRRRGAHVEASVLHGLPGYDHNPFGGLNFGMVDVETSGGDASVRLRLFSHDDGEVPRARTVFDTGEM